MTFREEYYLKPHGLSVMESNLGEYDSLREVKCETQVPGEGNSERFVELENFDEIVNIDTVNVTVGQSSHVNYGLSQSSFFPAGVSTDIIFPQEGEDFPVLDHLQRPGYDEDEVRDALTLPDDEVPGGAVSHPEVCGQRPETAIAGKSEGGMSIENSPGKTYLLVSIYMCHILISF